MLSLIFESRARAYADSVELSNLRSTYGDNLLDILRSRANDQSLAKRDQKHWNRILSKAVNGR
jgi:hypothetical protein